jgi:translation initiation factor 2 subunit 1
LKLDEDTLADLRLTIGRRLTPKPVKVRADVEVKCFAYQGIEAIKKSLSAGEACSTSEVQIKIRLVAPPLYVMSTTSTDKSAAIEVMEKAVERIGKVIAEEKGDLTIKMAVSRVFEAFEGNPGTQAMGEEHIFPALDVLGRPSPHTIPSMTSANAPSQRSCPRATTPSSRH